MERTRVHDLAARVLEQLTRYDALTNRLMTATGLCCPPGCARCCESLEVEASVLELLPLAVELWRTGEADRWLERAVGVADSGPCVFHDPARLWYGQGRCRIYPLRPLVCRLFGYAASRDKHGRPRLGTCRFVNQLVPEAAAAARLAVEAGVEVACFADAGTELAGLDPGLGRPLLPINLAVAVAIERVGFALAYERESGGEGSGFTPGRRPRGRGRRRVA